MPAGGADNLRGGNGVGRVARANLGRHQITAGAALPRRNSQLLDESRWAEGALDRRRNGRPGRPGAWATGDGTVQLEKCDPGSDAQRPSCLRDGPSRLR